MIGLAVQAQNDELFRSMDDEPIAYAHRKLHECDVGSFPRHAFASATITVVPPFYHNRNGEVESAQSDDQLSSR